MCIVFIWDLLGVGFIIIENVGLLVCVVFFGFGEMVWNVFYVFDVGVVMVFYECVFGW